MPSASNKIEKPASTEVLDPVKQGIVLIEHKVRNLMKKKSRLDAYRDIESSGKELDPDQKLALKKYDELCQNLAFAQELSKQFNTISVDWGKLQKKKEKKDAYEREQQETVKVKEILIIQDVLAGMGHDSVREDFLAGKNKAVKLTETELQYLDELFVEVSPKRDPEENQPSFLEQAQNSAKHLLNIVENKDKEIVGTKYTVLKDLIEKINSCGYFDPSSTQESAHKEVAAPEKQPIDVVEPEADQIGPDPVQSATFQPAEEPAGLEPEVPPVMETAGLYISQRPMADVLTNVMGAGPTTFNFIQESELEPDVAVVPAPLPIPTQTFTNASFVPRTAAVPPQEVTYTASTHVQYNVAPPQPLPQPQPTPTQTFENNAFQNPPQGGGAGDWSENTTEQNDWAMAVEQSEQNTWSEPAQQQQQGDDWIDNNDGFQPATRGSNRGGRGRGSGSDRGRGGPRGRGYQNGRGNYGSNQNGRGGYYNRNSEGGYQNGYQPRNEGDRPYRADREGDRPYRPDKEGDRPYRGDRDGDRPYRGGREGGDRSYRGDRDGDRSYRGDRDGDRSYRGDRDGGPRRGGPRGGGQDRGGPRGAPRGGGNRGGNNPRGSNRGNHQ